MRKWMCHTKAIYHVCVTGERQVTDCCDCKKFFLQSAPRYHCCSLFFSKLSSWGALLHVSTSIFSLFLTLVLQCWGCSIRVADAAVHSAQTRPNRLATRLFKMSTSRKQNAIWYSGPASMQQNLNRSENGQHQDNALWSIHTHSQPTNTFGKLQVFFLHCEPMRNKGQKHSLPSHLDGFSFQISLEHTVYVSRTVFKPPTTKASVQLCSAFQ